MNLSYWERGVLLNDIDFAIVGAGFVGLTTAIEIKKKYPNKKIIIFEKSNFIDGASIKNAGFACFGSISEILEDIEKMGEENTFQLISNRIDGFRMLQKNLGDNNLKYQENGSYEIFTENEKELADKCIDNIEFINNLLRSKFNEKNVFALDNNNFGINSIIQIKNNFEGSINTAFAYINLRNLANAKGIVIINNYEITQYNDNINKVEISCKINDNEIINLECSKLVITNNAWAKKLVPNIDVNPGRTHVLVTEKIEDLKIQNTFHHNMGYNYFRNIDNRLLLGGGRNLKIINETTYNTDIDSEIYNYLIDFMNNTLNINAKIEYSWTGTLGLGYHKKTIVRSLSTNVICGVRMGGMGVSLSSFIASQLKEMV